MPSEAAAADLLERATLADRQARGGDALALLEGCEAWPVPDNERGILLRASILLQRDRIAALDALPEDASSFSTREGRFEFYLLNARAHMVSRNMSRARDLLELAANEVREEEPGFYRLAHYRALFRWLRREYDPDDANLLLAVHRGDPMTRLIAYNLRSWMHAGLEDYSAQMRDLVASLAVYDEHQNDCHIEGVARSVASIFASAWEIGETEAVIAALPIFNALKWTPDIQTVRFFAVRNLAWYSWLQGDNASAQRYLEAANAVAPTAAWKCYAALDAAYIARLGGIEAVTQQQLGIARTIEATVDWGSTRDEERIALLHLAVLTDASDPDFAASCVAKHQLLYAHSMNGILPSSHEPRRWLALRDYAEGRVEFVRGNTRIAVALLAQAHSIFASTGHYFRAAMAAHALFRVTHEAHWLATAREHASVYPRSSLAAYLTSNTRARRSSRI